MSVLQEKFKDFFDSNGWTITDEFNVENGNEWSLTATKDNVKISVDTPREDPVLNNVFVRSHTIDLDSVEEYDDAVAAAEAVDEFDGRVEVISQNGLFERAKGSPEHEFESDRQIVERLDEKDVSFGVQFSMVTDTHTADIETVASMSDAVRACISQLDD